MPLTNFLLPGNEYWLYHWAMLLITIIVGGVVLWIADRSKVRQVALAFAWLFGFAWHFMGFAIWSVGLT